MSVAWGPTMAWSVVEWGGRATSLMTITRRSGTPQRATLYTGQPVWPDARQSSIVVRSLRRTPPSCIHCVCFRLVCSIAGQSWPSFGQSQWPTCVPVVNTKHARATQTYRRTTVRELYERMATAADEVDDRKDISLVRRITDEKRYVVWTQALEEKLLTLWRSRRCLFDPNSLVSKPERREELAEIAADIGVTG